MDKGNSIQERASFENIRYANCWEDAEVLLAALDIHDSDKCLSIASAGDNSLSLLTRNPGLVVAVDVSQAQLACVEIKKWCFTHCSYDEMTEFLGLRTTPSSPKLRLDLFSQMLPCLSRESGTFWEGRQALITSGIINQGRFENYFHIFRTRIMPLIHSRKAIASLLKEKTKEERIRFYENRWNNRRWNLLFRFFFSRTVMGRLGRDPEFFRYVDGPVAASLLKQARHALTECATHDNPYLHFILTGGYGTTLPHYARRENFEAIRSNIDKLELFRGTTREAGARYGRIFNAFNLSDIFEYMDTALFESTAQNILDYALPGARIAYWNMLVPRSIAGTFQEKARCDTVLSKELHLRDKAFFYQRFNIDTAGT